MKSQLARDYFQPDGTLTAPLGRLVDRLRLMRRGDIFVAVAGDPLTRREVVSRLAVHLFGGITFLEFSFVPEDFNLPRFLHTLLPPTQPAVVIAYGLADLPEPEREDALRRLNFGREAPRETGYRL